MLVRFQQRWESGHLCRQYVVGGGAKGIAQKRFQEKAPEDIRALYQRHARGNALYRNQGDGTFQNVSQQAGVEMGRWAWCSDFGTSIMMVILTSTSRMGTSLHLTGDRS